MTPSHSEIRLTDSTCGGAPDSMALVHSTRAEAELELPDVLDEVNAGLAFDDHVTVPTAQEIIRVAVPHVFR